jgi:hypothetical protein
MTHQVPSCSSPRDPERSASVDYRRRSIRGSYGGRKDEVLVTGMSGTGKSSALAELGRRGYRVVDTDEPGWSEWVVDPGEVGGGDWLWVEERMSELRDLNEADTLVFRVACGTRASSTPA